MVPANVTVVGAGDGSEVVGDLVGAGDGSEVVGDLVGAGVGSEVLGDRDGSNVASMGATVLSVTVDSRVPCVENDAHVSGQVPSYASLWTVTQYEHS